MLLNFEERLSDSPLVDRVWRTVSERDGHFTSVALSRLQICMWCHQGQWNFTVRGPETKASTAYCPPDTEFFGIVFKLGAFMPYLPTGQLVDGATTLPDAGRNSFWLQGATWEFPDYDNVDTFVDRLVRSGQIVREPIVDDALRGRPADLSTRSVQRRFLQATGLTQTSAIQIDRARHATLLLRQGVPILDTVEQAGYYDQPHLTRSLRHYIGMTPTQLMPNNVGEQLSFLYNT